MKKPTLILTVFLLILTVTACQTENAKKTDKMILEIGTVTKEKMAKSEDKIKDAIEDAAEAFDELSEKEQKSLENLEILQAAQKSYELLSLELSIEDVYPITAEDFKKSVEGFSGRAEELHKKYGTEAEYLLEKVTNLESDLQMEIKKYLYDLNERTERLNENSSAHEIKNVYDAYLNLPGSVTENDVLNALYTKYSEKKQREEESKKTLITGSGESSSSSSSKSSSSSSSKSSSSSSSKSSSSSSSKCPNCKGLGRVRFYYGASDLEAYLSGHDPYTWGTCPMCHGTGR